MFRFVFYQDHTGMSATLGRAKNIKDKFSSKQPGLINVAGEVFFLNLPDESQDDLVSNLFDDSVKGDLAFQYLFLGGLPKEDGGPHFTKKEQTDLRRIFRAIFGPRQRLLPTMSQVATVGRRVTGKTGIVMPSKPAVFALPCSKADRELMVKALQIRRTKLIEQIQAYDETAVNDIHARYMRDHLKKLNQLIDDEIPDALKSNKNCRPTGIIDPNAPPPLPLSDERMNRLLEIFAYLLAQGKDPTRALRTRYPDPNQVITTMAQPDAPDIYEYEEEWTIENPGKTPEYTPTLMKIRKVLEGDEALSRAVLNDELKAAFENLESVVFGGRPDITGTYEQRKKRILDKITALENDAKEGVATKLGLDKKIADLNKQVTDLKTSLAACEAELAKFKAGSTPKADFDKLTTEKTKIETELTAAKEELKKLAAVQKELEELKKAKGVIDTELGKVKAEFDALKKKCDEDVTAHTAAVKKLEDTIAGLNARIDVLTREGKEKDDELTKVKDDKIRLEAEAGPLREQLAEARRLLTEAEARIAALTAAAAGMPTPDELAELRRRATAAEGMPTADELAELRGRPTRDELAAVQANVGRLTTENGTLTAEVNRLRPLQARVAELEREKNSLLAAMRTLATTVGLEGEVTPEALNTRLQALMNELREERTARTNAETARATAEAAARTAREALNTTQRQLENERTAKETAEERVGELEREIQRLTRQITAGTANEAAVATLTEQLRQARLDTVNAQENIRRLTDDLATATARAVTAENALAVANERVEQLEQDVARVTNDATIATRRAETAEGKLNRLLGKINEFLTTKEIPQIPYTLSDEQIDSAINAINAKLAERVPAEPIINENIMVCMLNVMYNLFKNLFTKHGVPWSGAADVGKFVFMFQAIETTAGEKAINDNVITIFMTVMKNLKRNPAPKLPAPSQTLLLSFENPQEKATYLEKLSAFRELHTTGTIPFNEQDRDMASYILRDFIPTPKSFTRYILTDDAKIENNEGRAFNKRNIDISTVFLYIFGLTKKILNEKADILAATGCNVNLSL
jgi:predicted  nucleic acid-binding Zn-ribbon protein